MATSTIQQSFMLPVFQKAVGSTTSFTINFGTSGQYLVYVTVNGIQYNLAALINVYGSGAIYIGEMYKGNAITLTTGTRTLTVTGINAQPFNVTIFAMSPGGGVSNVSIT